MKGVESKKSKERLRPKYDTVSYLLPFLGHDAFFPIQCLY